MPDIEFVEADPPAISGPAAEPPIVLDRRTPLRLVPALIALVGAALAAWAPFLWIYSLVESSDAIRFTSTDPGGAQRASQIQIGYDGWGRTHSIGLEGGASGHGPRDGAILVACAALLVLGAAAVALASIWRNAAHASRLAAAGRALLVAAAAGSAAVSASFYLAYSAARSQFDSLVSTGPANNQVIVRLGHAWLVAAIGALLALLAAGASLIARVGTKRDMAAAVSQPPQSLPVYVSAIDQVGEDL